MPNEKAHILMTDCHFDCKMVYKLAEKGAFFGKKVSLMDNRAYSHQHLKISKNMWLSCVETL